MWLFTDFGYLLPTITVDSDPMRKHKDWDHYSNNGEYTFQVRARLSEHLDYYIENFAEEGTYGPIWRTPDHDYNFRVFTTQEAFAQATASMVLAIDYRHFKDESTKFPRGKEYHDLLIKIWSASCALGDGPGGIYGDWSEENPMGYRSAAKYEGWGTGDYEGRRIGDSFDNIDFGEEEDEGSWSTDEERRVAKLVDEMDRYGVTMEDWPQNLLPSEFKAMLPILKQVYGKKKIKRMIAENRQAFNV